MCGIRGNCFAPEIWFREALPVISFPKNFTVIQALLTVLSQPIANASATNDFIFALDFFCPRFVALRTEAYPADQRSVGLLDTVGADGRLKSLTIALVAQFDFLARALAYDFHPLLPSLDVLSVGADQLVAFFQTGFFSPNPVQPWMTISSGSEDVEI